MKSIATALGAALLLGALVWAAREPEEDAALDEDPELGGADQPETDLPTDIDPAAVLDTLGTSDLAPEVSEVPESLTAGQRRMSANEYAAYQMLLESENLATLLGGELALRAEGFEVEADEIKARYEKVARQKDLETALPFLGLIRGTTNKPAVKRLRKKHPDKGGWPEIVLVAEEDDPGQEPLRTISAEAALDLLQTGVRLVDADPVRNRWEIMALIAELRETGWGELAHDLAAHWTVIATQRGPGA